VIEIPKIKPFVIEHPLHRLNCPQHHPRGPAATGARPLEH
jgi:hypothetical protein